MLMSSDSASPAMQLASLRRSNSPGVRVLLIADSIHWITGTIARWIAEYNPWIVPTICSGSVVEHMLARDPAFIEQFDLIHSVCPYSSRSILPMVRDRRPIVTSIHHVLAWESELHNLQGDAIMVVARQWQEDLLRRGVPADSVVLVPNGVNCELFAPRSEDQRVAARKRLGLKPSDFVVGFVAKQSSNDGGRKGIDVFEAAIAELSRRLPGAAVLLVGMGWKNLVSRVRAQGVRCVWVPYLESMAELAHAYNAMDCYWVTSRLEGGPVPLLEAMSSGVPCVTTPVGLAVEIVQDGHNAFMVPKDDPQAFVARSMELTANPQLRAQIGHAARKTILEKHRYEVVSRPIAGLYALAVRRFAQRTGRAPALDVEAIARQWTAGPRPPLTDDDLLEGIAPADRAMIRRREQVAWIRWCAMMRQHREMMRAVRRCMPRALIEPEIWMRVLYALLPAPLARLIRRLRGNIQPQIPS